ncbi:unknown protein [Microcystis aeruginosa NIES-843]|uniref:Uncharacterized protein n=1 Tax=Microcystis aeruginosa (strain NIES-843 / IAM M-2473) TaxID=449447 RepID=B0JHS6_MICAN|nr:unknown protein [Microcystis aeruginosa NIES-843]
MVGLGVGRQASVLMKKFSPPQMKEVSFPTPVTVEQEVAFPPPASKPDLRLSPYPAPE